MEGVNSQAKSHIHCLYHFEQNGLGLSPRTQPCSKNAFLTLWLCNREEQICFHVRFVFYFSLCILFLLLCFKNVRDFPEVWWLRLHALKPRGTGLIPSWGTKTPHDCTMARNKQTKQILKKITPIVWNIQESQFSKISPLRLISHSYRDKKLQSRGQHLSC